MGHPSFPVALLVVVVVATLDRLVHSLGVAEGGVDSLGRVGVDIMGVALGVEFLETGVGDRQGLLAIAGVGVVQTGVGVFEVEGVPAAGGQAGLVLAQRGVVEHFATHPRETLPVLVLADGLGHVAGVVGDVRVLGLLGLVGPVAAVGGAVHVVARPGREGGVVDGVVPVALLLVGLEVVLILVI